MAAVRIFCFLFVSIVLLWSCLEARGQQARGTIELEFTPGVSSLMLRPGQLEVGLYTGYSWYDELYVFNTPLLKFTGKRAVYSGNVQTTFGIAKRISLGFDVQYAKTDDDLSWKEDDVQQDLSGWSFGPRIRYALYLGKHFNLINQSYALFPDSAFHTPLLATQFIGTLRKNNFLFMGQLSGVLPPNVADEEKRPFFIPLALYAGYKINNTQLLPYLLLHYLPEFGTLPWAEDAYYTRRSTTNLGGGIQTALGRTLVYAYYTHPIASRYGGGFNALNVGLRFTTL